MKTQNWQKTFTYVLSQVKLPLLQSKVFESCLSTHDSFIAWLESVFILKEETTIPIFHLKKKLNGKKCEKSFY